MNRKGQWLGIKGVSLASTVSEPPGATRSYGLPLHSMISSNTQLPPEAIHEANSRV